RGSRAPRRRLAHPGDRRPAQRLGHDDLDHDQDPDRHAATAIAAVTITIVARSIPAGPRRRRSAGAATRADLSRALRRIRERGTTRAPAAWRMKLRGDG